MFADQFTSLAASDPSNREERNDPWNGEKAPKAEFERAGGFFFHIPSSKTSYNIIYAQECLNKSFQILESFPRG